MFKVVVLVMVEIIVVVVVVVVLAVVVVIVVAVVVVAVAVVAVVRGLFICVSLWLRVPPIHVLLQPGQYCLPDWSVGHHVKQVGEFLGGSGIGWDWIGRDFLCSSRVVVGRDSPVVSGVHSHGGTSEEDSQDGQEHHDC